MTGSLPMPDSHVSGSFLCRQAPIATVACLLGTWFFFGTAASAEDTVYLRSEASSATRELRGEILDFTGREVRLQAGDRVQAFPTGSVARVEYRREPDHAAGDALFEQGDFRAAAARYRTALDSNREPREWVRRKILAQIVWCQRNLAEWDQAGEYFLIHFASDPETPDFHCLPLVWIDERPSPEIQRRAREWLNDDESVAILMGASQLLSTGDRALALGRLKELLRDSDPRIAWLAYAQLWRAGSHNATLAQQQALAKRIAMADASLRAGAAFTLARSLADSQPEQAATLFMTLPILSPREYSLAALALAEAGNCLERVHRPEQAARLYREIQERFAHAPVAQPVQHRLERLAGPMADPAPSEKATVE